MIHRDFGHAQVISCRAQGTCARRWRGPRHPELCFRNLFSLRADRAVGVVEMMIEMANDDSNGGVIGDVRSVNS